MGSRVAMSHVSENGCRLVSSCKCRCRFSTTVLLSYCVAVAFQRHNDVACRC